MGALLCIVTEVLNSDASLNVRREVGWSAFTSEMDAVLLRDLQ